MTKVKLALVAVLLIGGAAVLHYTSRPAPQHFVLSAPKPALNLQPENTPEWTESDSANDSGRKTTTRVTYRNGFVGMRYWTEDGSRVQRELAYSPDGIIKLAAEYAGDQVVNGFKKRADDSTVWQVSAENGRVATKISYWSDGKSIFCVQRRRIGGPRLEETYFYRSGKKAMHFIGSADGETQPSVLEVWKESGQLSYSHYTGLNETSVDTVYRDNGFPEFKQLWATRAARESSDSEKATQTRLLLKVELFNEEGELSREYMMAADGYILQRIVDHTREGKVKEMNVLYDGSVTSIKISDANNPSAPPVEQAVDRKRPPRVELDSLYREEHRLRFDVFFAWRAEEDDWSAN